MRAITDETPAQKKARLQEEKKAEKAKLAAEKKAAAAEAKAVEKHNNKQQLAATKAITVLPAAQSAIDKITKQDVFKVLPESLQAKYNACKEKLDLWLANSNKVIGSVKSYAKNGNKLPDLGFQVNDLQEVVKDATKLTADFTTMASMFK